MLYIILFVVIFSNHLLQWLPRIPNWGEFIVQSVMLEFFTDRNETYGILKN